MALKGRRTKCTPELTEKICGYLSEGNYIMTACELCGIDPKSYHNWYNRGRDELDRIAEEGGKPRKREQPFVHFFHEVTRANAEAERRMLEIVVTAAVDEKDVRAAQWYLARKHPEKWAKRSSLDLSVDASPAVFLFVPEEHEISDAEEEE